MAFGTRELLVRDDTVSILCYDRVCTFELMYNRVLRVSEDSHQHITRTTLSSLASTVWTWLFKSACSTLCYEMSPQRGWKSATEHGGITEGKGVSKARQGLEEKQRKASK